VNPAAERLLGRTTGELLGKRLEALGSPLADALDALPP
jgi:PAS domain-containing protein